MIRRSMWVVGAVAIVKEFRRTNRGLLSRNTFEKGDKLVEMGENK